MDLAELRLKEKTIVISGPLTRWAQTLAHKMVQLGADIVFMDKNVDMATRFASQLSEAREINEKHGRAAAVAADFSSDKGIKDAVSRAAEYFGGLDAYVDGLAMPVPKKFSDVGGMAEIQQILQNDLGRSLAVTQHILPFLLGRKKSRLVFVAPLSWQAIPHTALFHAARGGLLAFAQSLSREVFETQCTVNCVDIGLTEDVLQQLYQGTSAVKALAQLRESNPAVQMSEPERVADVILFLVSGLAQAINGQMLSASNGAASPQSSRHSG